MVESLYKHKRVFIATRHNKEQVIAPIFQQVFDARPFVSSFINTDQFGTFTREIERKDSPLETLRKKCEYGRKLSGCNLVVASEGSFGAHPSIPFTSANEEIVLFTDYNQGIEIMGKHLSTDTNHFEKQVMNLSDLDDAFQKIGFPEHGIIIRNNSNKEVLMKGIEDESRIRTYVSALLKEGLDVQIESDMRALYNPTRMKIIQTATENLIEKINSLCPSCKAPGFTVTDSKPGLPCSECGLPTRSIKYQIKTCQKCKHEEKIHHPFGKEKEDPMYCEFCNP